MLIGTTFPAHGRYNPSLATHFFRYFRFAETSVESEPLRARSAEQWRVNGAAGVAETSEGEFGGAQVPPSPPSGGICLLSVETLVSAILD